MDKQPARIEIHSQLSAFYSKVFSMEFNLTPHHISLYVFLLNQNNRSYWVEWFKLPFDLAMQGAGLGSKATYYKVLQDLCDWGFIEHQKGENSWKAAKVKIVPLRYKNEPQFVPQCEPLLEPQAPLSVELRYENEPQSVPQSVLLPIPQVGTYIRHNNIQHIINILLEDFQKILDNEDLTKEKDFKKIFKILGADESQELKGFKKPTETETIEFFESIESTKIEAIRFFTYYESNGWKVGKNKMKDWKASARGWIMRNLTDQKSGKFQNGTNQHHLRSNSGVVDIAEEHNRKGMERLGMIPKTANA